VTDGQGRRIRRQGGDLLECIAAAIAAGHLVVPIAATFPIEQTRAAVDLQRSGHVHGKVVITLHLFRPLFPKTRRVRLGGG
jgi:NADPH:quinone reductase-like Zn-dependent oxidoreductase